uniref:Uncharacterized protein n=1 Tax=Arion vulgaris TaxID=1028688 RepID=A0A0B6ZK66_9EUPU
MTDPGNPTVCLVGRLERVKAKVDSRTEPQKMDAQCAAQIFSDGIACTGKSVGVMQSPDKQQKCWIRLRI